MIIVRNVMMKHNMEPKNLREAIIWLETSIDVDNSNPATVDELLYMSKMILAEINKKNESNKRNGVDSQ